jgi:UDP-N-acetylmuramate dehydrogenase
MLPEALAKRLAAIPCLTVRENEPLSRHTRFALGGPARILADAGSEAALAAAIAILSKGNGSLSDTPHTVIGGGSNLVVADAGYPGVILRYTAHDISIDHTRVHVEAGAMLQDLVDQSIAAGLKGMETMTGIPGWVGGAIYGNAGAYGTSIHERVESVRFFDGTSVREIGNAECEFHYRESIFKRRKDWIILSATLQLAPGKVEELTASAARIRAIRDEKYPPTLRCAGSIFKNLILKELPESVRAQVPESVIREGKVPSAYFLEQVGSKGLVKGGIRVADYHANLIYNADSGTSGEVLEMISELKNRVLKSHGLQLSEEVQYVGC